MIALLSFRNFSGLVQLQKTGITLVSSLRSVGERVAKQNGKDVSFLSLQAFLEMIEKLFRFITKLTRIMSM